MINLLFTCIACFLSFLPFAAKAQNVSRSENVFLLEDSPKEKNVLHNNAGAYYCATSVDLQSTYFLWMTYYRLGGSLGTNDYMFDYTFNCYATSFANFNLSSPFDSANSTYINALSLTCLRYGFDESGKRISNYSVTLYYDNAGTETPYLTFTYSYIYPNVDSLGISGNTGSIFVEYEWTNRYFYWPDSNEFYRTTSYFYDIDSQSMNYSEGYSHGYYDGERNGYQSGYQQALDDSAEHSSTASTIFEGIFDVGLLPVNVFLTIFNFEVFGINIAGIVSGLLTLAVVVIILRFLLGGKKDDK